MYGYVCTCSWRWSSGKIHFLFPILADGLNPSPPSWCSVGPGPLILLLKSFHRTAGDRLRWAVGWHRGKLVPKICKLFSSLTNIVKCGKKWKNMKNIKRSFMHFECPQPQSCGWRALNTAHGLDKANDTHQEEGGDKVCHVRQTA